MIRVLLLDATSGVRVMHKLVLSGGIIPFSGVRWHGGMIVFACRYAVLYLHSAR